MGSGGAAGEGPAVHALEEATRALGLCSRFARIPLMVLSVSSMLYFCAKLANGMLSVDRIRLDQNLEERYWRLTCPTAS